MGSLTEYFGYLRVKPKELTELKQNLFHITPNDEMKKVRRELKLWKNKGTDI